MDSRKQAQYFVSLKNSVEIVRGLIEDRRCFLMELEILAKIMRSNMSDEQKIKEISEKLEFYVDNVQVQE